jgi:hypothetical protein
MSFSPGFTPTFRLTIPEGSEDLTTVDQIHVTFEGAYCHIDKSGSDITIVSGTEIEVTLTQEETLRMWETPITAQLNWLYPTTQLRWGTEVSDPIILNKQLLREVITRG